MNEFLTVTTKEKARELANFVTKSELIDFILQCDSSYTRTTAENFLEYLQNRENSGEKYDKGTYLEFVFGVIGYGMLFYGYDFEKIARTKLESYKSHKIHQAEEEASKWRKETRRANFERLMINFYLGKVTKEEAKKEILGNNSEDSWYARNSNELKTLAKIEAKKQTKSHTLEKAIKVIEDDIERGYADWFNLTEEQKEHANRIEKSHGFITRW